jgi:hypothetical protein
MRTIAITLLLAAVAAAEEPKQPAKLTNQERLTLENLSLRAALARIQAERIQEEQQAALKRICERAGVPAAQCAIDPQKLTIERHEEAKK